MIVTIDGPAGAGKSSAARGLAERLGFRYLDTGAMYRAVALAAVRRNLSSDDPAAWAALARQLSIVVEPQRVLLDGDDVTAAIRTLQVTNMTRHAANNPDVREHLVELQRQAAGDDNVVTDGRDQGTVAFPDAMCKIYLTASPEERARRRQDEMRQRGERTSLEEILARQNERDQSDAGREVGPLLPASDSVEVATDGLNLSQVVDQLEQIVRARMSKAPTRNA